jgi:hypothetical protein
MLQIIVTLFGHKDNNPNAIYTFRLNSIRGFWPAPRLGYWLPAVYKMKQGYG